METLEPSYASEQPSYISSQSLIAVEHLLKPKKKLVASYRITFEVELFLYSNSNLSLLLLDSPLHWWMQFLEFCPVPQILTFYFPEPHLAISLVNLSVFL